VNAELAILPSGEMRSVTRRIIDFGAFVRDEDAVALQVRCRDISTDGCRIEGAGNLAVDAQIWIKMTGLAPLRARVVWVREQDAGCEFFEPLHPEVIEQLLVPYRTIVKGAFTPPKRIL
jgi:hypothetical protein